MKDQIRSYVDAGREALSPAAAREMARSLLQAASPQRVQSLAQDLMTWSARSRERITQLIQHEVAKQLKAVGVATKDDLDALRKRLRDLEKASSASPAKKTTARKSPARKSTSKRSSASRSTASSPSSSADGP